MNCFYRGFAITVFRATTVFFAIGPCCGYIFFFWGGLAHKNAGTIGGVQLGSRVQLYGQYAFVTFGTTIRGDLINAFGVCVCAHGAGYARFWSPLSCVLNALCRALGGWSVLWFVCVRVGTALGCGIRR